MTPEVKKLEDEKQELIDTIANLRGVNEGILRRLEDVEAQIIALERKFKNHEHTYTIPVSDYRSTTGMYVRKEEK